MLKLFTKTSQALAAAKPDAGAGNSSAPSGQTGVSADSLHDTAAGAVSDPPKLDAPPGPEAEAATIPAQKPDPALAVSSKPPNPTTAAATSGKPLEDVSFYSRDLVRVHDPRYRWAYRLFSDQQLDSSISFAFRSPFLSPYHWPLDPFRSIVGILRRKEYLSDIIARDQLPVPGRDQISFAEDHNIVLGSLHNSRITGQDYMELLTNLDALRRAEDLLQSVKKRTGDLPAASNSNGVAAQYVDLIHVGSILSDSIEHHRGFVFNVSVESIFSAESLEVCLVTFIRRIIEEGTHAEAHESVLCAKIRVSPRQAEPLLEVKSSATTTNSSKAFVFYPSETTSAKKGAILSTMKAAAIDGGTIALEMYLLSSMTAAAHQPESKHLREIVHGYTMVSRKYNFWFIDSEKKSTRCFSRNPYETIAAYAFVNSTDANYIRDILIQHFESRLKQLSGNPFKGSIKSYIREYLYRLGTSALQQLDAGEMVSCVENLLSLMAHGCSGSGHRHGPLPLCGQRMTSISRGLPGVLRSIRDAIENANVVCVSLASELSDFLELRRLVGRGALPHGMMDKIKLMQQRQLTFPKALSSIRDMLASIMRDIRISEIKYVNGEIERYLIETAQQLRNVHEKMHQLNEMSRFRDDRWERNIFRPQFGDVYITYLRKVSLEFNRISSVLSALETSVSADMLLELIQIDVAQRGAVKQSFDSNKSLLSLNKQLGKQRAPVTLEELLGFVFNLCTQGDIHAVRWYGVQLTPPLQRIICDPSVQDKLPTVGKSHAVLDLGLFDVDAEEKAHSMNSYPVKDFWAHINARHTAKMTAEELNIDADAMAKRLVPSDVSKFFRVYPALSALWQGRIGGINAISALIQEAHRYDCPRSVAEEATRMRYLIETGVFSSLRESFRDVLFQTDRLDSHVTICAGMYKCSTQLLASRHSKRELLSRFVLFDKQSIEKRLTDAGASNHALSGPYRLGYHKLAIETGLYFGEPYDQRHGAAHLRGGIFGPIELLSGLANWRAVFMNAWLLPPLLTRPLYQVRGSDGITVEYFGGIAGETALSWGTPNMSRTSAERRDRQAQIKPKVGNDTDEDEGNRNFGLFGSWFCGSSRWTEAAAHASVRVNPHPNAYDGDAWSFDATINPVVEIVIKVTKSSMQNSDQARDIFVEEVISNIEGLRKHSRWTVHEVATNSLTAGHDNIHNGVEAPRIVVYPHWKNHPTAPAESASDSLPPWATKDFLLALRTNGECKAECAVLMALDMQYDASDVEPRLDPEDPDSYDFVDFDGLTNSESIMVARECETRYPEETVPKMYPALLSHLKYVSSAARMELTKRLERRAARMMQYEGDDAPGSDEDEDIASFDKWWGGGEGWRGGGAEEDNGRNLDPTSSEHHRLSVDSYTAEYVQDVMGLRSDSPRVYVPCTVRFSLLCFSTSEDDGSSEGLAGSSLFASQDEHDPRPNKGKGSSSEASYKMRKLLKKSIVSAVALTTMQKATQGLIIGTGRVVTRLISSTVWLSPEAAFGVWSCLPEFQSAKQRDGMLRTLLAAESNSRVLMAKRKSAYCVPDATAAYKDGAIAALLSGDPSHFTSCFVHSVRMTESLAHRAAGVVITLRLLRRLLHRPVSGLEHLCGQLSPEGVATTLVVHVSLCTRLVIAAPQCVHFHGACYKILQGIHDLESIFELGSVPLAQGMRNYCASAAEMGGEEDSDDQPRKWKLPLPSLSPDVLAELKAKDVVFDGSSGVRRVLSLRGTDLDAALELICLLEGMCGLLATALADDVRGSCGGEGGMEVFISNHTGLGRSYDAEKRLAPRVRNVDRRTVSNKNENKKPAATDEDSTSGSDLDQHRGEEEVGPHPDMDVFLGLVRNIDDSTEYGAAPGGEKAQLEDDIIDNPRVLLGRNRIPRQERLAQLGLQGGDVGMIDELRGMNDMFNR